jgi:hypothetical protein
MYDLTLDKARPRAFVMTIMNPAVYKSEEFLGRMNVILCSRSMRLVNFMCNVYFYY